MVVVIAVVVVVVLVVVAKNEGRYFCGGLPLSTSAKFSEFPTPSPLSARLQYTRNYISAVGSARQQVNCPTRGVDQNLSFRFRSEVLRS